MSPPPDNIPVDPIGKDDTCVDIPDAYACSEGRWRSYFEIRYEHDDLHFLKASTVLVTGL